MSEPPTKLRVGIDVGGTNTDAVVLDDADSILAKTKVRTTANVTDGVRGALDSVLGAVDKSRISHVMLGTTHATNAVVQRNQLRRVAVLRIGGAAAESVRPFFGWPDDLREAVCAGAATVDGGSEFDRREIAPLDTAAIKEFLSQVATRAEAVAITSVFAPVCSAHEEAACALARDLLGEDIPISMSHEIGGLGIINRENSTILNAALGDVFDMVAGALTAALSAHEISPSVLFTQNDGTLMGLEHAIRYPVLTIGSGPANSLRGAAFLTQLTDTLVADVGGTTTDIGVLVDGFPRQSSHAVEIGGVRTNIRMPDILAVGLGGGTVVRPDSETGVRVGPDSLGYRLHADAVVFGGDTPTLTDAAVLAGRAAVGTHGPGIDLVPLLTAALESCDRSQAAAIDQMKLGRAEGPLVVVGGGSMLIPDRLPGVSRVLRPDHFDVANAVGAAIAQVGGAVEEVIPFDERRAEALVALTERARDRTIAAGADPSRVTIVDIEETPLAYMPENAARVRVKAVGPLGRL